MTKAILFRVVLVAVAMIALSCLPQQALAQRGGHGGGGGFHGGGGGFHGGGGGFHGSSGGAFRGGGGFSRGGRSGFGGSRSGFGGGRSGFGGGRSGNFRGRGGFGWGGRNWGRGFGYGRGWGWGFGFGWPYWGWGWGYPYGYYDSWDYSPDPYYSYPYYGPSDYPPGYAHPDNGDDDPPPADPRVRPQPNQNGPARSWRPPVPVGGANANYANSDVAAVAPRRPVVSVDSLSGTGSGYRAASAMPEHSSKGATTTERGTTERAASQADTPLRPEVQKALQRLREMPPFAREREIETGRYRQFSSEEKQILRNGE